MPNRKRVGSQIRKYRHLRRLTLEELAGNLNFDYSYLAKIERGERKIDIELLSKIAAALNVPAEELIK